MIHELKANYYFGVKPQAKSATVYLEAGQFHIIFVDGDVEKQCYWKLENIKPDQNESDGKFILQYGTTHPYEFLEFEDPDAQRKIMEYYPDKKWKQTRNVLTRNPIITFVSIIGILIMLALGLYFLFVPKFSDMLAKSVSVRWEVELGEKMSKGIIPVEQEDKLKSKMLDTFFVMMDVQSKYPIHFHFINDSVVNAFAIPGGNIVIYKGLFDKIKNYESLAGLMGHEFTHVENKHSLKTIFRSMSSFIMLAALFGDLTGLVGVILENANSIQNLSYSREFEKEADASAVHLLLERKIGLTGMLDLFNVFLTDEKKGLAIPKFLSTHPVTEDRIEYVKSKMGQKESDLVQYLNLMHLFNRLKAVN